MVTGSAGSHVRCPPFCEMMRLTGNVAAVGATRASFLVAPRGTVAGCRQLRFRACHPGGAVTCYWSECVRRSWGAAANPRADVHTYTHCSADVYATPKSPADVHATLNPLSVGHATSDPNADIHTTPNGLAVVHTNPNPNADVHTTRKPHAGVRTTPKPHADVHATPNPLADGRTNPKSKLYGGGSSCGVRR